MKRTKTITTLFIVPTLKIPPDDLTSNNFLNGYVKDDVKEYNSEDTVLLLFKPPDILKFNEFLSLEYERNPAIVEDYNINKDFIVVVYKLNPDYKADFTLIKQGKYSKTSKQFQTLFPAVIKRVVDGLQKDELSLQTMIFRKAENLIQYWEEKFDVIFNETHEVWYGWDDKIECITNETLLKYDGQPVA